jgi:hypothetical protein
LDSRWALLKEYLKARCEVPKVYWTAFEQFLDGTGIQLGNAPKTQKPPWQSFSFWLDAMKNLGNYGVSKKKRQGRNALWSAKM